MGTESQSKNIPGPFNILQYRDGKEVSGTRSLVDVGNLNYTRVSTTSLGWIQTMQPHPFNFTETRFQRNFGLKRQHSAVSPLSAWSTQWSDTEGRVDTYNPTSTDLLSSVEKLAVISRVRTKARLKVKDQKVNLVQAAAEMEQTVNLLATNIARIGKAYAALRGGNFAGAAKALGVAIPSSGSGFARRFRRNQSRAVSTGWLELQYGWYPLISDCYGVVEVLQQRFSDMNPIQVISAVESIQRDKSDVSFIGDLTRATTYTSRYDVKVVCRFRLSQELLHTATQLGITNPALIAWELLPFSFVVDWFLPIGNFISSWDATLGVDFLHGSETTFKKNQARSLSVWNGPKTVPAGWKHYNKLTGNAESWHESVSCVRVLLSDFPAPIIPVFKDPLSVTHFFNALALLKLNLRK